MEKEGCCPKATIFPEQFPQESLNLTLGQVKAKRLGYYCLSLLSSSALHFAFALMSLPVQMLVDALCKYWPRCPLRSDI